MVVFHPNRSSAYVTNFFDNNVSVIRTLDRTVVGTIPVGLGPSGIDITSDGLLLYEADSDSNTVSVIRTKDNIVIQTVNVGDSPFAFGTFITAGACFVSAVPTLGHWSIILLVGILGIAGFIAIRRKSALQS